MIFSREGVGAEAVARHYDELDNFYREVWGEHLHHGLWRDGQEGWEQAIRQMVELVVREAQVREGTRLLDIGCGYGATARLLAREFGASVTGLTISPKQFLFASSQHPQSSNPSYLLADWMTVELPEACFDCAIAVESSEHMPEKARFFSQAARALRPDGLLVVCAWLAAAKVSNAQERWLLEPICRECRMPHLGTFLDYQNFAQTAGFRLERFEDLRTRVLNTWPFIARRFLSQLMRRPGHLRFLFGRHARNRVFALTVVRLWLAYRTGAMSYGIFTFRKGGSELLK